MLNGFYVFHKKHPTGHERIPQSLNSVYQPALYGFKTCLRHIYFAHDESESIFAGHDFEIYKNETAYQFIAEVLCGLHSPVVGETEVFGQFKNFRQNNEFAYSLKKIFDALIVDIKKIRGEHLTDLGGQSYGSLIRKLLPSPAHVTVIGAGSFVRDILPWIHKDKNHVEVFARDVEKANEELSAFERLTVRSLSAEKIESPVVIVAAPLTAAQIEALVESPETLVIDLRGESREDACAKFTNYKDLNSFFEKIQKNQTQILKAKTEALSSIGVLSRKKFHAENPRPFGWEDICVW